MKKLFIAVLLLTGLTSFNGYSQEKYGHSFNLGLGLGYRNIGPALHLNYEFDVAKSFTLAPFIGFQSYSNRYYYGNPNKGYQYYGYRRTVVPVGVKGSYYFDELLKANQKWDFYLAGSLGFAIIKSSWDDGYSGPQDVYGSTSPLYLDIHIGAEYHLSSKIGLFLDLSSGISTIGLSIHK